MSTKTQNIHITPTNWWPVTDEEWEILNGFRPIPTKKQDENNKS
jgi:hypothetical protein